MNASLIVAILLTACAMVPGLAHVLELPHKVQLKAEGYLTVKQVYQGWSLLGVVVAGSLISTLWLSLSVERDGRGFRLALGSLLCVLGSQVICWTLTFPVNHRTKNGQSYPPIGSGFAINGSTRTWQEGF